MYCNRCGTPFPAGSNFCSSCGQPIAGVNQSWLEYRHYRRIRILGFLWMVAGIIHISRPISHGRDVAHSLDGSESS